MPLTPMPLVWLATIPPGIFGSMKTKYQVWNGILKAYARCALTKPSDKFVAISGVAKDSAKAIDDEYLAGLWRRNLINGLLWTVADFLEDHEEFPPVVRPKEYRAPSWSWASLYASTTRAPETEYKFYGEYAEVQDVVIEPAGDDPTGELRHACPHLSGHLIRLRRKPVDRGGAGYFGSFTPDTEEMKGEIFLCLPCEKTLSVIHRIWRD